jgi:hypothetical protein
MGVFIICLLFVLKRPIYVSANTLTLMLYINKREQP